MPRLQGSLNLFCIPNMLQLVKHSRARPSFMIITWDDLRTTSAMHLHRFSLMKIKIFSEGTPCFKTKLFRRARICISLVPFHRTTARHLLTGLDPNRSSPSLSWCSSAVHLGVNSSVFSADYSVRATGIHDQNHYCLLVIVKAQGDADCSSVSRVLLIPSFFSGNRREQISVPIIVSAKGGRSFKSTSSPCLIHFSL